MRTVQRNIKTGGLTAVLDADRTFCMESTRIFISANGEGNNANLQRPISKLSDL
jgi:hypothetical protein